MNVLDKTGILELLRELLHEKYDIPLAALVAEARQSDLALDSMLLLDVMLDVEELPAFKQRRFQFRDMSLPANPSLSEIVDLIAANLPAGERT